jgi:hypothetical protein
MSLMAKRLEKKSEDYKVTFFPTTKKVESVAEAINQAELDLNNKQMQLNNQSMDFMLKNLLRRNTVKSISNI